MPTPAYIAPIKYPQNPRAKLLRAALAEHRATLISDPLMTLAEVREVLNCSYAHLQTLFRSGALHCWQARGHGMRRVRKSELMRFLATGDPA
jgi:excisionase family DNA binding protein